MIIIAAFATSAFAQDLTPAQQREFEQLALSVQVNRDMVGGVNAYGGVRLREVTSWSGFHGFDQVSHPEFYRIAGYEDLANQIEHDGKTGLAMLWGGGIAMTVGLIVAMVLIIEPSPATYDSYGYPTSYSYNYPMIALSSAVGIGGVATMIVGQVRFNRAQTPAARAISVAEEYNEKLKANVADE
jgi:hypothetical protein